MSGRGSHVYSFTFQQKFWMLLVFLCTAFMVLAGVFHWALPRQDILFYNETASLLRGIYLRVPAVQIERGDIVVYDPPKDVLDFAVRRGYTIHKDARFLKRVGAIAGDVYSVETQGRFYINGVYMGQIKETDHFGHILPQLGRGEYIVPCGAFLPLADAADSFDGRYTGTVPLTSIRAVVIPVFTLW